MGGVVYPEYETVDDPAFEAPKMGRLGSKIPPWSMPYIDLAT